MTKDLEYSIKVLGVTRNNVINFINELTYDELCKVPNGFNNSILWNAVHCLTVQQLLCYRLSNQEVVVNTKFIDPFKKGATGKEVIEEKDIPEFKDEYLSTIVKLKSDYGAGLFTEFTEYTTSYNITLNHIDEVINFNNTHEGLHFGYMMTLKRAL